jgi:putative hydrolase of the HAD superfamily
MKTIVLDMYGVIIKEGHGNFKTFLAARRPEADYSLYEKNYDSTSRGEIKCDEFMRLFGFNDAYYAVRDYTENFLTFDTEFIVFAEKCLTAGVRLALLSNDISEFSRNILEHNRIGQYFSVAVVSGDVGMRKPDTAIYRLTLDRLNIGADDCIFIDDNPKCLATAAALGGGTVLFRRDGGYDGKAIRTV